MVRDSAPPLGAEPTRRQGRVGLKVVNWEIHLDSCCPDEYREQWPSRANSTQVSADSIVWSRKGADDVVALAARPASSEISHTDHFPATQAWACAQDGT